MSQFQVSLSRKKFRSQSLKYFFLKPVRSMFVRLHFWLLMFFNFQTFGDGINFCYDGAKEGHRLDSEVIKFVHAQSGMDCVLQCMIQDKSCRSVNFRKISVDNDTGNCELLHEVDSENPKLLHEDEHFDYLTLLQPNRTYPETVPSSTPQKSQNFSKTIQELLPSCKELLMRNSSLSNGVYKLRNNHSLEEYSVYCHVTDVPGCGTGGWTLVMKIDGNETEFNYSSPFWTNKETYAVKDGLKGLTEKQTKLASYWNTPFDKICLGMKVNNVTNWIVIGHQASSLFNVIAGGNFTATTAKKDAWKSLMKDSYLQNSCDEEGFNIEKKNKYSGEAYNNVRIGLVANNQDDCESCDSCIGFGTSLRGCDGDVRSTSCGNIMGYCAQPENDRDTASFGYILVQ